MGLVNNKLALDIGGIHQSESDSFNTDDLHLEIGKSYDLDIFFAERHTVSSHFTIRTSLEIMPCTDLDFSMLIVPDSLAIFPGETAEFEVSLEPFCENDTLLSLKINNIPRII